MEREVATLAGLGWRGQEHVVTHRSLGQLFFPACVLVDIELARHSPHLSINVAPATAVWMLPDGRVCFHERSNDACRLHLVTLTIESREMIPVSLRDGVGDLGLFGCDVWPRGVSVEPETDSRGNGSGRRWLRKQMVLKENGQ